MKGAPYPNIQILWRDLAAERGDQLFLRVPASEGQVLSYKVSSFYKRVLRASGVFKGQLNLSEGDHVAVLTRNPHDLAFLLHGLWFARLVAVPLDVELPDNLLVSLMTACKIKAVVFPLEASARIASMFSQVAGVDHWIVAGSSTNTRAAPGVKKFEDLFAASLVGEEEIEFSDKDVPALVVCGSTSNNDARRVSYTQRGLISAAHSIASIYPSEIAEDDLAWCLLSRKLINGLLHSYLVPLFTRIPGLVVDEVNLKEFWTALRANGATVTILDQAQLRFINRKGRPRTWIPPNKLRLITCTHSTLSTELYSTFERRFKIPVQTSYSLSDGGGMITALPLDLEPTEHERLMTTFAVPSSGISLGEYDFSIIGEDGAPCDEGKTGEIVVRNPNAGVPPLGVSVSRKNTPSGDLRTGDEGFYVLDSCSRKHLYVLGRRREAIRRKGNRVFPGGVENYVLELNGVEFALVVGFKNSYVGSEVGLYMVTIAGWNSPEKDVWSALRKRFSWDECPKVVILNERPGSPRPKGRLELQPLFEEYFSTNFAEGRQIIKEFTERNLPSPGNRS